VKPDCERDPGVVKLLKELIDVHDLPPKNPYDAATLVPCAVAGIDPDQNLGAVPGGVA